jgi:crotonobetainyl-CoA:carnitine CoA-transferase CaiB-like acyl-CoA transferase
MSSSYQAQTPGEGPLAGVLVLDLAQARSGPTCVRQLVQLGADAIQIWAPGRADLSGSDFANMHYGKRSMVLDLRTKAGLAIFMKLAKRADVLVENFRPQVKERLGIAPEDLWKINPRLIYGSLSGYGQDGPNANRPGIDPIIQGYGGLMSVTGQPGTGPSRVGIAISDTASGTFLAQAILAALYARERTGKGQWVHTSLLESMISMLDFQATKWLIDKVVPGQTGNQHPSFFPMGTFRTKDGFVNIGAPDFQRLCRRIGLHELADDPQYQRSVDRVPHREKLTAALEGVLMTKTTAEWIEDLKEDVPCGPVFSMDEVFTDAQVQHLNVTRNISHPKLGDVEVLRYPVSFSHMPIEAKSGVETPGASTRAVLAEEGYSEAEIEQFIKDGVAATSVDSKGW